MSFLADLLSTVMERRNRDTDRADHSDRTVAELCADLLGTSGEMSGMVIAREVLERYAAMNMPGKKEFFGFLVKEMGVDPDAIRDAVAAYETAPDGVSYRRLMAVSEAQRQELARRLNQVPGATGQLVNMRRDLLGLMKQAPEFAIADLDFRHLFGSWFNRGFLVLRPISWESPADILEKIIAYEAVHAIDSWEELRRRLQPDDRRCFAFFHPSMPNEPLIFVEVALTRGIAGSIQDLLREDRGTISAQEADTAVFYSISNCQDGLAGISFGNSLIKQVVADLSRDLPQLETFVTLSPIPGLADWTSLTDLILTDGTPERQCQRAAFYLLNAKREDGTPFDPVARFHLGNGAQVHAVHANADVSATGIERSGGTMVNYLYDLSLISGNHERYAATQDIAASPDVRALALVAEKQPA